MTMAPIWFLLKIKSLVKNELYKILQKAAQKPMSRLWSKYWTSQGIDLGSSDFTTVKKPEIALLVGDGVRSYDAGEIWHLLDTDIELQ